METVETYEKRGTMRFSFPPTARSVADVDPRRAASTKAYGDHVVFPGVDLTVQRGEKIGIIGVNGAGKTTLLRMIAGELPHDGGTIKLGSGVEVGYYAQHHADTLDMTRDGLRGRPARARPRRAPARVRSILGAFMFSRRRRRQADQGAVGRRARARRAGAAAASTPGNLLLMDEPTNHLDLASSESLAAVARRRYDGTLVFVSHNRSLIRTLATRIWNVEDGARRDLPRHARRVHVLDGAAPASGRGSRDDGDAEGQARRRGGQPTAPVARDDDKAPQAHARPRQRQKRSAKLGPLEKQVAQLEERIGVLEAEQKMRSAELADPDRLRRRGAPQQAARPTTRPPPTSSRS